MRAEHAASHLRWLASDHLTEAQAVIYRNLLLESGFILNPYGEPTPPPGMGWFSIDEIAELCRRQAIARAAQPKLGLV